MLLMDHEASVLSEVPTGPEGSGDTTSALPAYWELSSGLRSFDSIKSNLFDRELMRSMQEPIARYMKDEDSQR